LSRKKSKKGKKNPYMDLFLFTELNEMMEGWVRSEALALSWNDGLRVSYRFAPVLPITEIKIYKIGFSSAAY